MVRVKKSLQLFFAALLLFVVAYYGAVFLLVKPEVIQKNILQSIEETAKARLLYKDSRFFYFPYLTSELREAQFELEGLPLIHADKVKIYINPFALLLKKARIDHLEIEGGKASFQTPHGAAPVTLEHLRLKMSPVRLDKPMRLQYEGDMEGTAKTLSGKIVLSLDPTERSWDSCKFEGNLKLQTLPVSGLEKKLSVGNSLSIKDGQISGDFHFQKSPKDSFLNIQGKMQMRHWVYESLKQNRFVSPPVDASLEVDAAWNPKVREMLLKRGFFSSPLGKWEASGRYFVLTQELRDARLSLTDFSFEDIPKYYTPFKEAIPINFGFSGSSNLELSLEGTLNHLSLHANWDFSSTLLTYAGYVSKLKGVPLNLVFDILLKQKQLLTGDFSLRLQDATIKGNVNDFNIDSGDGELNILTNKFQLANWQEIFLPFRDYSVQGEVKVFANLKGNLLQRPQEIQRMVNVILENGSFDWKKGAGLRNVNVSLDYSLMQFELKRAEFEIAHSPLSVTMNVFDPLKNPNAKIDVSSSSLDLGEVLKTVEDFASSRLTEKSAATLHDFTKQAESFFPPGQLLKDLNAKLECLEKKWTLKKMDFKAYEGAVQIKGLANLSEEPASYQMDGQIDGLELAQFFAARHEKLMTGKASAKYQLMAKAAEPGLWQDLSGSGQFSLSDGSFQSFDLLDTIAKISDFSALSKYTSGSTSFQNIHSDFNLKDGKLHTPSLTFISRNLLIKADGEISLEGALNYRLNAFFPFGLLATSIKDVAGRGDKQFGPVPLLLSGTLNKTEIKADPALLPKLQDDLAKKKTQNILRNFLREDFLPNKS